MLTLLMGKKAKSSSNDNTSQVKVSSRKPTFCTNYTCLGNGYRANDNAERSLEVLIVVVFLSIFAVPGFLCTAPVKYLSEEYPFVGVLDLHTSILAEVTTAFYYRILLSPSCVTLSVQDLKLSSVLVFSGREGSIGRRSRSVRVLLEEVYTWNYTISQSS